MRFPIVEVLFAFCGGLVTVGWLVKNLARGSTWREFLKDMSPNPEILCLAIIFVFLLPPAFFGLTVEQSNIIRLALLFGALVGAWKVFRWMITGKIPTE